MAIINFGFDLYKLNNHSDLQANGVSRILSHRNYFWVTFDNCRSELTFLRENLLVPKIKPSIMFNLSDYLMDPNTFVPNFGNFFKNYLTVANL
jgi:hypothetical protein